MVASNKLETLPKFGLILHYENIFQEEPPQERIGFLKGMCKRSLIAEFAAINHKLKPHNSLQQDFSLGTQIELLDYFCGLDKNLYNHCLWIMRRFTPRKNENPLIFTRATCLFALEETLQSDLQVIEGFLIDKVEIWTSIFKYLLAVNFRITEIEEEDEKTGGFETLNPKMLPLNELILEVNPLSVPFRGYKLMEYFSIHNELGIELRGYLSTNFQTTFDKFIYDILGMLMANRHPDQKFNFYYYIKEENERMFDAFSKTFASEDPVKLLSTKKFPFYKRRKLEYYLLDNTVLIEKTYNQFIYDFWFDWIKDLTNSKGIKRFDFQRYKGIVGYFFESYLSDLLDYSFRKSKQSKNFVVKLFGELLVRKGKKKSDEIADVYIRSNSKILLGQVKSTNIYDVEKYSGNIDSFYKHNRNEFFKNFGVNQLIESLAKMDLELPKVDSKFPAFGTYQVFPVLIVSEKALQTPFMAKILHDRFIELLPEIQSKKIHIYPLSVIHINDLEDLQEYLHKNPSEIWDLLKYHCRNSVFMPPFYNSINKKNILPTYSKTIALFHELASKFSPPENQL